jgi:ribosomal protein L7/L12
MNVFDLSTLSDSALSSLKLAVDAEVYERTNRIANLPELNEAEVLSLKCGKTVKAIKFYRDRVGCSLRDAKHIIDNYSE